MKTIPITILAIITALTTCHNNCSNADVYVFVDDASWTIPASGIPQISQRILYVTNESTTFDWDVVADISLNEMTPIGNDFAVDFELRVLNLDESGLDPSTWSFTGQSHDIDSFQWELLDVQRLQGNTTDRYFFSETPTPQETAGYFSNPPMTAGGLTIESLLWNDGRLPNDDPPIEAIFKARIFIDPADNFTAAHFPGQTLVLPMRFSITSIPEPASIQLLVGGLLMMCVHRRKLNPAKSPNN